MLDRKRLRRGPLTAVGMAAAVLFVAGCGGTGPHNRQNALHPAGPAARTIINLMSPFFWIAVVIGAGVVGMTIFVALRFRERPGEERSPVQTHGNTVLEVSWTIIPFLILAVMAVPTVATIFKLAKIPKGPNVVHIHVDARQWFWQYQYTDKSTGFYTANEMHIPINKPVLLYLTSENVIHSFWVPELAGKERRRPRPPEHAHDRGQPSRHLHRPVRRVLRHVARQHAPPRDRADPVRLRQVGRRAEDAAVVLEGATSSRRTSRASGAACRATRSRTCRATSARPSAPTSPTSVTARRSPATSTR